MAYDFTSASTHYLNTDSTPVTAPPLTIAAWFYTGNTTATVRAIVVIESASAANARYGLLLQSNNVRVDTANGASQPAYASGFTTNTWQHAAASISSTAPTAYLNGVVGGTAAFNYAPTVGQITIGAMDQGTSARSDIRIAEVGIWNTNLSAADIRALSKGFPCSSVRPQNLRFYAPLIREIQDVSRGLAITNNNSTPVIQHPRVYA